MKKKTLNLLLFIFIFLGILGLSVILGLVYFFYKLSTASNSSSSTEISSVVSDTLKAIVNSDFCISEINEIILTPEYDEIFEENKNDYLIDYQDEASDEYKTELTDLIVRLGEYQREELSISTKDFENIYIFVDVYFNKENFAQRFSGTDSTETYAIAYASSTWGNMVLYVDSSIPLDENKNLYRALSHELVHLIQFAYYKEKTSLTDAWKVPDWYLEGMALNNEFCLTRSDYGLNFKKFKDLDSLSGAFRNKDESLIHEAYKESYAFYGYLQSKYSEEQLTTFLNVPYDKFYENAEEVLGVSLEDVYNEWKASI